MIMSSGFREGSVSYNILAFSWASLLLESQITKKVSLNSEFKFYS